MELLKVENLVKKFPIQRGIFKRTVGQIHAVDGVSLTINAGETVGLVGESGCGKSTTARLILRLLEPTSGKISFLGEDISSLDSEAMRNRRKDLQIVFQDPYASLNPRMTIRQIIAEPLIVHGMADSPNDVRIDEIMELCGLSKDFGNRYPHEFSGGQRQRVGIARALVTRPKLVVLDEPVSALDVSVQAQILNLLDDLKSKFDLSYLFVAHDLSVISHISDRVAVMYLGKIVEFGDRQDVFENPRHPYTQALLSAVPIPDPKVERNRKRILLQGELPSPANPPSGCRFHTRCHVRATLSPELAARCASQRPALVAGKHSAVACHAPLN